MDITMQIKQELLDILESLNINNDVNFIVEIPKDTSNGDYATNIALQLTKILKRNPKDIATLIVSNFNKKYER